MTPPSSQTPNEKAVRLVDYLLRIASLQSKVIRNLGEYDTVLWLSDIPHARGCYTRAWGGDEEHESEEWLEVQSRPEPQLPAVPAQCRDWVDTSALRNKQNQPELLPQILLQSPNPGWSPGSDQPETIPCQENLKDHPDVQRLWAGYVEDKWLPWAHTHETWVATHSVYSRLFAIHQAQIRLGEEYELVLGLGLLTWHTPAGHRVRRHLIVANVVLEFETRLGKFTLRPHAEGANLRPELDMLDIEEQPARAEQTATETLAASPDDPWQRDCVEGVLQSLVHSIDPLGIYEGSLEASIPASAKPVVEYAPALILRKRSAKGLTETLKRIKSQLEHGASIPGEFADLAEVHRQDEPEWNGQPESANGESGGEVFFPKPANEEQRLIVEKFRAASGVLVQGPPGTGKSHTIANLICHLLATGQRTLITAKTPRALQVLEGLLPSELRPLCINLLGSGPEERRSLESSVHGILTKRDQWNEDSAIRERNKLEERLQELRKESATCNRRLRAIRESEACQLSVADGAYCGTAARIAEAVNRDRTKFEWFKDEVPEDETCQISSNNLRDVLDTLRQTTPEKRRELNLTWPEMHPSPERIEKLVQEEVLANAAVDSAVPGADERYANHLATISSASVQTIHTEFSSLQDTCKRLLATSHPWMGDALRDILSGNSRLWHELLRITHNAIASVEEHIALADETRVEHPDTYRVNDMLEDARQLKSFLSDGGKLGWGVFRPKPVKDRLYILRSVKIGGQPCNTVEQLTTLVDVLHVQVECERAWASWKGRCEKVGGPYALQLTAIKSLRDALDSALALEDRMAQCRETLKLCPHIGEPIWTDEAQIESVVSSCLLALARLRQQCATRDIQDIEARIMHAADAGSAHPVTRELLQAVHNRDVDKYRQWANVIQDLEKQRQHLRRVDDDLAQLRRSLPHLSKALEETYQEPYWEERIQHIQSAWRWAQARFSIEEHIRREDVPALAKRARQIDDEINNTVAMLAALHAWSLCFSRLKDDHRRHMEAWKQSIRKLGKGTGKYAPRHRREAQEHLNHCREAVPAWVMPLHRIWDTVDPAPGMFDVIIVDEASQCGLEALPLFYLGKKMLIVGDDKQISPDAVGLPRDQVLRLMDQFLHDFRFRSSFDVESSLFDHGQLRYGTRRVTLREHFRCMPEIIRFSNGLCYSDTPLIPLRQYGPDRLPPLEHVLVPNGYREGSNNRTVNKPEAEAIARRIADMCGDRRYDGKTMGVVVLQGEAQATWIENLLLERLGADEMARRRLVCGNPYSFQGDERDVMFLSLVAANNERIGPLTKPADERRFNVAASRARDQMILYHSVTCDDLSGLDLRRRLLEFFEQTEPLRIAGIAQQELQLRAEQDNRHVVKPPPPFESWFEVDVALELQRRGYVVLAQYEVAGKRIDLVVEGGQARLAVECDGDNWHGTDRDEADWQRQRQLERCGWEFFRIRESAFYLNREDALAGLWRSLEERRILPVSRREKALSQGIVRHDDPQARAGDLAEPQALIDRLIPNLQASDSE